MEKKRDGNKSVKIKDPKTGFETDYSMSIRLKRNLDEKVIPDLQKKDKDCFLVIDGREGAGKSWLAFQIGKYVDPTLNLDRVVFSAEDFREVILKSKKGQCVIFDEAFTGLSSRASLSMINKVLISLTMQMRQKNLFVIIVLPSFFMLDKYIALFRARALVHVFESKGRRGYFRLYNQKLKKYLYLAGQKTYSYHHKSVKTNFRGRFYGKFALGDESVEKLYRKKKMKALMDTESNPLTAGQAKYKEQRDLLVYLFRKYTDMTYKQIAEVVADYNISFSYQQIQKICAKFGDIVKALPKEEDKTKEKVEIEEEIPEEDEESEEIEEDLEEYVDKLGLSDELEENTDENDDFD